MKNVKHSKIAEISLFIFLFLVIFSRVYIETKLLSQRPFFSYFVATHHCAWFTFVFFYFALCARYILGLKSDKIPYLSLLSPVIYLPLIHAKIAGVPLKLQYLRGDFSKILFDISTFYLFSKEDNFFFFEMIALLVIFAVLSYIVSRNVLKTLLNIIVGFYGSMFLAGIQFFGVAPGTKAVFKIHTIFKNHILLSLIYFTAAIIVFSACYMPEIKALFKCYMKPLVISLACGICTALTTLFIISIKLRPLKITDFILLTVLWTVFVLSSTTLKNGTNLPGNRFFPMLFSAMSLVLMLGIIFRNNVFI